MSADETRQLPRAAQGPDEMGTQQMGRRSFLKALAAAGVVVVEPKPLEGEGPSGQVVQGSVGVLVDTTRCMGCRSCEFACAKVNDLPKPDSGSEVFERERTPTEIQWSVINRYETDAGKVYVKQQCMHCVQPACASACLTKAMAKQAEGPVIWRESKCMGCRFCMISCPFDAPKFEYDSPVPKIQKCNLCWDRLQQGDPPACVANCPAKALTFGRRRDLIEEARRRIVLNPDKYIHYIYGEHEVGGTSWLYLSAVPFEQLGFRTDLGTTTYPALTKEFLYSVPIVLTLVPAFLLAVRAATKREPNNDAEYVADERRDVHLHDGD